MKTVMSEPSDPAMAEVPVTPEQKLLMQMAFDGFVHASWPRLRWLQWMLDKSNKEIDVAEHVDALSRDLGGIRLESVDGNSLEVLALTVTGCARCEDSEDVLEAFLALLRICIERYLSAEHATLRSDDLAGWPNQALAQRARRLLQDEYIFLGNGGGNDESWQYEVSPAIRYFREVRTLGDYVDRRRWYMAEPRPRRVRGGQAFHRAAIDPMEPSGSPAELFAFMRSEHLRKLAQRDHAELLQVSTTKARAVLAGAVVESMLLDRLAGSQAVEPELLGLSLGGLYQAARAKGVVTDRLALVVPAMRDFRNLGHPGAELRDGPLTEHEADIAVSLMRILIAEFSGTGRD